MASVNEGTDPKSVVLVGIDFSPQSRDILRTAERIAMQARSELHLVHVLLPAGPMLGASRADRELALATQVDHARGELNRFVAEVPRSLGRLAGHVRVGTVDVEIAQLAADVSADLIVVGTHGRTGVDRLFLGSTAESLIRHAPCQVLVWRPKSAPAWSQLAPPCADCVTAQKKTDRAQLWCERHSSHHLRAHTYYEVPQSYGIGAQTFR